MKANSYESSGERQRSTRRLVQSRLLPLVIALAWTAGQQNIKAASETSLAGNYTLVSVDGKKVPCAVQHEGTSLTVKSGGFTIKPEGTCSSKMVFSVVPGQEASREVKATYTRQGSKLTMKWEGAGTTSGTIEGDTFTMNNEGMIFVYRK
jgi:hypothetical protein